MDGQPSSTEPQRGERGIAAECIEAAQRPWKARPGPRAAERIPLFLAFVPERLIFRGHPALPFVLTLPFIGFWLDRYAARPAHGVLAAVGLFVLGALLWTLIEYLMHRFLFHFRARGPVGQVIAFVVHGHHHVTPLELSRLAATPVQLGSLALLVGGLVQLAWPEAWTLIMAGFLSAYAAYEAIHHLAHHDPPRRGPLAFLVRHHLRHHYERSDACWGISSPLWDWIFRSHR